MTPARIKAALTRRADHLEARILASDRHLSYDEAELSALRTVLKFSQFDTPASGASQDADKDSTMKVWILTEERNVSAKPMEGPEAWVDSVHATLESAKAAREKIAREATTATGEYTGPGSFPMAVHGEPRCEKCGALMEAVDGVDDLYACECGEPAVICTEDDLNEWDVDFEIREFEVIGSEGIDNALDVLERM